MDQAPFAETNLTIDGALSQVQRMLRAGQDPDAAALCQRILEVAPQNAPAIGFLGLAHWHMNQQDIALVHADRALQIFPDCVPAHCVYGFLRFSEHKPLEAIGHLLKVIARWPDLVVAHNLLGVSYAHLGDYERALVHLETVLHIQPDHAHARSSRSVIWLAQGKYEQGWLEFEWRWRTGALPIPYIPRPRWDGSDLTGRRLLIHGEQGIGDTVQFVRLLPLLKQRGARVVFACQKALHALLGRCEGIDEWLPIDAETRVTFDMYAPMASLPDRLHLDEYSIPRKVPYVFPDPQRVEHWRPIIQSLGGFKIGICWQGSKTYGDDYLRSLPLRQFAPLANIPTVRLISLQKGYGEEQIEANRDLVPVTVLDRLDETGGPLMDTAAVMKHLDLVITCNTSIVHVAGSLAAPTWVALSTASEWHWPRGRTDSPWYPTLRVFRQKRFADWDGVFAEMCDVLRERIDSPSTIALTPRTPTPPITVDIAPGELFDKLTILEIKSERIADADKLANIHHELEVLRAARPAIVASAELDNTIAELKEINQRIWEIEDGIRECERQKDFGPQFVELARSVYHSNDRRGFEAKDQ